MDLDPHRADDVAGSIQSSGTKALAIGADITDSDQIVEAWESAVGQLGTIDILVNGAGRFTPTDFVDLPLGQWRKTLDLQLTAPFVLCQQAVKHWIERRSPGAIVNVASTAAIRAKVGGSADYGASKAGMLGLTIDLAVELGPYGIRTNAVLPHSFHSPINATRLADPVEAARAADSVPLKRIASADEVAAAVVYLALDASYSNGVLLPCDGGTTVSMV